ncbi:serine/threonine protein kinase, partial [Cronobacter sakazakii]
KMPGLIAAGVLVGLVAGGLLFGGSGDNPAPETASNDSAPREQAPAQPPVQNTTTAPATTTTTTQDAAPAQNAPVQGALVAQIYVRMGEGEQLALNGKTQTVTPAENGFASLQLPTGDYELTIKGRGQTRSQTINVSRPGTWLVNP